MSDAAKGSYFDDENQTVAQYMERWLEDSARGDLGHRAYHNYKLQIRRHISPAFGRLKLSNLTASHIRSLYAAHRHAYSMALVSAVELLLLGLVGRARVRFFSLPERPLVRFLFATLGIRPRSPRRSDRICVVAREGKG